MKKIAIYIFLPILCLFLSACESGNMLRTASFSEITSAGSEDYTFKVIFSEDERVDEKYYDIQIKADGNKSIVIGKEFEDKKEVSLTENWQSLTTLLLDEPNTETFTKGKDAITLVYIFNAKQPVKITLRAVVGGITDNAYKTGKIITNPEAASNEFVINTK